eukprot:g14599.t1
MKESNHTKCYDPNLEVDEDATCDAVTRGVRSDTFACWAAPGSERLGLDAYDDNFVTDPDGLPWNTGWYQSCCYPRNRRHELLLIEEERIRDVKRDLNNTYANVIGKKAASKMLRDLHEKVLGVDLEEAGGKSDSFPITDFALKFLQDIEAGRFNSGDQTGEAVQRLFDGAIYERRKAIRKLYNWTPSPPSASMWKTPETEVVVLGDLHIGAPPSPILLNDGETALTYKTDKARTALME